MPRLIAKSHRPEAERAVEWALIANYECVHTRRALRTKFAKVDFFAADAIGLRADGTKCFIQVTAGQAGAVAERRKKLEQYPWHPTDTVEVWQLTSRPSLTRANLMDWFFRVWKYVDKKWDGGSNVMPVPKAWFKAYKGVSDDTD